MTLLRRFRPLALPTCMILVMLNLAEADPADSHVDWLRQCETILAKPGLIRHYGFEDVREGGDSVANLAGDKSAPLVFKPRQKPGAPAEGLRMVPGRWPQKKALRLDQDPLTAEPFPVTGKAFTAAAWMRFSGPGTHRGNNGVTNGTLLSAGTGYWDGWRLTLSYPSKKLGFEIGRPKPSHSISVQSSGTVSDGVWHHVAVSWDGSEMRLYIDGLLSASGSFDGEYTAPPPGNAFRVGYANAGFGSVVLAVDEVAVFSRALSEAEMQEAAALCGPEAPGVRRNLARTCRDRKDFASARAHYRALLASPRPEAGMRLEALFEFADLCEAPADTAELRRLCAEIVASPAAPGAQRSVAQLCLARSFAREKNYLSARAEYAKLATLAGAPPHHRQEAQECIRELERVEQGLPARDPLASRTPAPRLPAPGVTFHVSPDGADSNPGTAERAFATLERARDEIRALKQLGALPSGGVLVRVRGGEYRVAQTFHLQTEDSGTEAAPIVYASAEGEKPRFTGGARVGGFAPVIDSAVLARLPEEARGKVWQVDLRAQGITDYGKFEPGGYGSGRGFVTHPMLELYFDGKPLELARWPNEGFVETGETLGEHKTDSRGRKYGAEGRFTYEGDRPARWAAEPDAWLYGYWFHDWSDSYEKVASIDPAQRVIALAPPLHRSGFVKSRRFYALNLLSEIDRPGEWFLDRASGMLYLWPPSDPGRANVEISMVASPFVELDRVSHVVLKGLEWDLGRGDALRVSGGEDCLLTDCTVRRFGGDGVIVNGGRGNRLLGCDIHTLGRGGVRISGGDRKTLAPSGHVVENCHIHHLSRIDHTYTPAVRAEGVGIRIAHNLMHHIGSSAMRIEGNDHLVEFNEVHRVVWESDDQGGVDMFGNPTYRGNVFRHNFFHHIGSGRSCGQAGIRLDDAISGTLIYGNVFWISSDGNFGGVQIHGGKDNWVDNNLFIDCKQAISFSPWGETRWKEYLDRPDVAAKLAEVAMDRSPYAGRYPELKRLREGADANSLWRNVAVQCGLFVRNDRGIHEWIANTAVTGAAGDVPVPRSVQDVAAWAAGERRLAFRPIPFGEIGLYRDPGKSNAGR